MKSLWYFFRLIRPLNLAVIALTMGVFQVFLSKYQPSKFEAENSFNEQGVMEGLSFWDSSFFQFDFLLLVLSTVLIAAAGNIINDYFDVKADRVNKPEMLIIDKYVKRRWAIVFNWVFNSVGLLIAMYLGWKMQNWFLSIIPFVCINLLWFYSAYFKRWFFIGNLVVALLVSIVPIQVLFLYFPLQPVYYSNCAEAVEFLPQIMVYPIITISLVAFMINLIREIVKDIADVKGDLLLGADTIPIRWGIKKSKWILFLLLIPLVASLLLYVAFCWEFDFFLKGGSRGFGDWSPTMFGQSHLPFAVCAIGVMLSIILSYIFLIVSNRRKYYLVSSNLLKLAMFFGLLTPLFL